MTATDAKDLTTMPTWRDSPWERDDSRVVYRNGDARLVVTRVWDDFAIWAEDEGQVPFMAVTSHGVVDYFANPEYMPSEEHVERAYRELGDWEVVARWLRIFHDDVEIARVDTITTGYSQGDFRDVLTIATKSWRDHVGVPLDYVREEVAERRHLKEFAAWCAGDYMEARIETADPDPANYVHAMDDYEVEDPDSSYWSPADTWIDAMNGPMHTSEDVNDWLELAAWATENQATVAQEIRESVQANGHWVI